MLKESHNLTIRSLKKHYNKRDVVSNINLEINSGEVVGLLGPNGAGKTTTFYMIVGFIKPDGGVITLDDEDMSNYPMYKRARKGITYLPQEPSIFKKLTVTDNIRAVLEIIKVKKNEVDQRITDLLEEFNLISLSRRLGYQLSGGERRRVEIARTLALDPIFVLLDEPFSGVDPIAVMELQKTINYLKEQNIGILITDHNVRETLSITDRACIINNGAIFAEGRPEELVKNEMVKKIYLGEDFEI
jgi:lipopolysaccharide export system ATP-binding protein